MQLPKGLTLPLMQTKWAAILNPIIANPTTNLSLLTGVNLTTGMNVINHGLGQVQQGWILTDIQGAAFIYRMQPFNSLTLVLHSSADVTVSLGVF